MSIKNRRKTCDKLVQEVSDTVEVENEVLSTSSSHFLWTTKYKPTKAAEFFGHRNEYLRLKNWLATWTAEDKSNGRRNDDFIVDDDSIGSNDFNKETSSCVLICGPPGYGKSCLVYAVAEECSYKVFEINSTMKRNGKTILRQIREGTQSNSLIRSGCVFTNGFQQSSSTVNGNFLQAVVRNSDSNKQIKRKKNGILNYFNKIEEVSVIEPKEQQDATNKRVTRSSSRQNSSSVQSPKQEMPKPNTIPVIDVENIATQTLSFSSNSLILFDDVDVLLEDDVNGFWSAVNSISEITKKPVILTATRFIDRVQDSFDQHLEIIDLNTPDKDQVVDLLENILTKEQRLDANNFGVCRRVLECYDWDIRRSINELNFDIDKWISEEAKSISDIEPSVSSLEYYSYLDLLEKRFNLKPSNEIRFDWVTAKCNYLENEDNNIMLAKEIRGSIKDLIKDYHNQDFSLKTSKMFKLISNHLDKNTSLKSISNEYIPFMSLICQSEAERHSIVTQNSRRSRRFMHHFDYISLFIDDNIKQQLISFEY